MSGCRLMVTAAGNSLYEASYLGLVPLVVAHNAHQDEFARNMVKAGACFYFGSHPDVRWSELSDHIGRHYHLPSTPASQWIDGLGLDRLVTRIKDLCA